MFEKMVRWIRNLLERTFDWKATSLTISSDMESAIASWVAMYENHPPWSKKDCGSLNLAAAIASELARLATIEAEITISGQERADFLTTQLLPFLDTLRNNAEYGCALGGIVFKPYVSNGRVIVDAVQGDCFFPVSFDTSGKLIGAVFIDQLKRKGTIYTRLEYHEFTAGRHHIQNKAFASNTGVSLGHEIDLADVPEWKNIAPDIRFEHLDRPLFSYFRFPSANKTDRHSPLGESCFAPAADLLRRADEQYGRYLWEFEGGELAIDAAADYVLADEDGKSQLPKGKKRLFRCFKSPNDNFYQVFSPNLRDESIKRGLNTLLQRIEFACGLAYGTLSDPQNVDKTAEEIKSSKQRSYATVSDIQKALQSAIEDLVYAMDKLTTLYHLAPEGTYKIRCNWDDSIVNDPDAEKMMFWQYVTAGKYPFWRYLVRFEGYSEEEAKQIANEAGGGTPKLFPGDE